MMKKLLVSLLLLLTLTGKVSAQLETTLPAMRSLYQASYINPAFSPEYKISIALPIINNLSARMTVSGMDLHTYASSINSDGYLDVNTLYDNIDGPVGIATPVNFDLLYIRFPVKGWYLGISNTMKTNQVFYFAKDFIGFLAGGNDYFKGKNQDYEAFYSNVLSYNETGVSISKEFKRLSIGARVKFLAGAAAIETKNIKMLVNTADVVPYDVSVMLSGNIQAAGLPLVSDADSLDGQPISEIEKQYENDISKFENYLKNSGWGLDLGFCYQVNTNLSFWGSVVDLGSAIHWKNNTYNYSIDESKMEFGGMNYDQATKDSTRTVYFDSLTSKLGNTFITRTTFNTVIPTKYHVGVDYDFGLRNRVGFVFQGQEYFSEFYSALTFNYLHRFGKNWQVTGNYTLKNVQYHDFGFGTSTKMGPFQFYFLTDNLMSFIVPSRARQLYLRLGINFVFGRLPKEMKMY